MIEIYGDCIEIMNSSKERLIISFSSSSFPIQKRWKNNDLSANFISDYLDVFLCIDDGINLYKDKREEIKSAISYIANELLENSMKYANENICPTTIQLHVTHENAMLIATNGISSHEIDAFKGYLRRILESNIQELYLEQLAASSEDRSGIGLISLLHDYTVRMGWKFETISEHDGTPKTILTTTVQLAFKDV